MKRLIVNADDLGADEARNSGILDAILAGSVTSVSILPNGPALEDAIQRIHSIGCGNVSTGIHINLSEGRPLSPGLRYITGSNGSFLGKAASHRLFTQPGNAELQREVRKEIEAQILLLRSCGISMDHLDGHQHIHIFPAVVSVSAEAAKANGISWIRIPEEPSEIGANESQDVSTAEEARFFSGHAEAARPLMEMMGIFVTDNFRGLRLKGRLPASQWVKFLDEIPNGLTELMVHPGRTFFGPGASTPFSGFSTIERETELKALIDGRFSAALRQTDVALTRFPEAFPV